MWCSACGTMERDPLCEACRRTCVAAPERIAGKVLVRAAYVHEGAPRQLVHSLKYGGSVRAVNILADAMAPLLDPATSALVPIPRTIVRRWKYGVDPGAALARAVSRRTGIPLVHALRAPLGGRANAGAPKALRRAPAFERRRMSPPGAVLVDDVVTTGRTINKAARALGGIGTSISATTVREVTSLRATEVLGGSWT